MNIATIKGVGLSEEAEKVTIAVFNGTGAEVIKGDPLCFEIAAADGKTVVQPTAGTNLSNLGMFAGLAQSNIGTADYSADVQNFGLASANVYGIATTLVPGSYLALVVGRSYAAYGSAGMFAGSVAVAQPICMTALATSATADEGVDNVFIKAL